MTQFYTVKSGDSLSSIAKQTLGKAEKWNELYELNKDTIKDPNAIKEGQKLKLKDDEVHVEKQKTETSVPNAIKITFTDPPKEAEAPKAAEPVKHAPAGVSHVNEGADQFVNGREMVIKGLAQEVKGMGKVLLYAPLATLETTAKGAGIVVGATVQGAKVVGHGIAVGADAVGKAAVATNKFVLHGLTTAVNGMIKTNQAINEAINEATINAGKGILKGLSWIGHKASDNSISNEFKEGYNLVTPKQAAAAQVQPAAQHVEQPKETVVTQEPSVPVYKD